MSDFIRPVTESELFWWKDRWWAEEQYMKLYPHLGITLAQVDANVTRVAQIFDEEWGKRNGVNGIHALLLMKGTMALEFLYGLGEDLQHVEGAEGLDSIIGRVRNPHEFERAFFELQVGAVLRRKGHSITFDPILPNHRRADVLAEKDAVKVFFELKKLRPSQTNRAVDSFVRELSFVISQLTGPKGLLENCHYQIHLGPELLTCLGNGDDLDNAVIEGTLNTLTKEIHERVNAGQFSFEIQNVGLFSFDRNKGIVDSAIIHPGGDASLELKRIIHSYLKDAHSQLHPEHPGIIIIQTPSELDESLTERIVKGMFSAFGDRASHVSTLVFLPLMYALPGPWALFNAFAVHNPAARQPASQLEAFWAISQSFLERKVATPNDLGQR